MIRQKQKLCFFPNCIDNGSRNDFEKQRPKLIITILHLVKKLHVGLEYGLIVSSNLPHILTKEYIELEMQRFRSKAYQKYTDQHQDQFVGFNFQLYNEQPYMMQSFGGKVKKNMSKLFRRFSIGKRNQLQE